MSVATITPKQLHDVVQAGQVVELIDVRTPVEFREVHVSFARNLPLDQLDAATLAAQRSGAYQTSQPSSGTWAAMKNQLALFGRRRWCLGAAAVVANTGSAVVPGGDISPRNGECAAE